MFPDWQFRKAITIQGNMLTTTLTDFPFLIHLIDGDLGAKAKADGTDIHFHAPDDSILNHEIEKYIPATGELWAWVNIPVAVAGTDYPMTMYYGNPDPVIDMRNPDAVWNPDRYMLVYHMADATDPRDATANDNHGSPLQVGPTPITTVAGRIGDSIHFPGPSRGIVIPHNASQVLGSSYTISFWLYQEFTAADMIVVDKRRSGHFNPAYRAWTIGGTGELEQRFSNSAGTQRSNRNAGQLPLGWRHWMLEYTGNQLFMTIDGERGPRITFITSGPSAIIASSEVLSIGLAINQFDSPHDAFRGRIDELRIEYGIQPSDGWREVVYLNQADPMAFYTVGPEESPPVVPTITPTMAMWTVSVENIGIDVAEFDLDCVLGSAGTPPTAANVFEDPQRLQLVDPGDVPRIQLGPGQVAHVDWLYEPDEADLLGQDQRILDVAARVGLLQDGDWTVIYDEAFRTTFLTLERVVGSMQVRSRISRNREIRLQVSPGR
jgi:hypothetical protein